MMKRSLLVLVLLFYTDLLFSQSTTISQQEAEQLIDEIYKRLVNGFVSFPTAARLYSEEPKSNKKGGLMRWLKKGKGKRNLMRLLLI